ncbi:keratin, type I cytoskeletal 12-like isoform X2 [Pelobates fuscus]|uniref:keratin, type I cytoskeletal 12-like isoform X2 n=1 Tax=Pelobates fuscus TaxID=191477 RepID=UPI002FE4CE43
MPYGNKTASLSSARFLNATSPVMSFCDRLEIRHVRTIRIHGSGYRPSHKIKMAGVNLSTPSQKEILNHLNDRLAAYLKKVHMLEESNGKLEAQIKELMEKRAKVGVDTTRYEKTIAEIKTQINEAKVANSELSLNVENTKLAADDFKAKYESELATQRTVIAEVKDLKRAHSDLQMEKGHLETEVLILTQELESLKKDHEEDLKTMQGSLKSQVQVEVDNAQAIDLSKSLSELRHQYESIADHHQKEAEAWFIRKSMEALSQNTAHTESIQSQEREAFKLKRKLQELEVQLALMSAMKSAEEDTLHETQSRYSTHLQNIQETIRKREDELYKIKAGAEQLSSDSRILSYLKDLLEMEIKTYSILMNDEEIRIKDVMAEASSEFQGMTRHKQKATSIITKNSSFDQDLKD